MTALGSLDEVKRWENYRAFLKERWKQLDAGEPFYISKERVDFEIHEKPWPGYVVLFGRKSQVCTQKLRKEGVLFREGLCAKEGDQLKVEGLPGKVLKGASKTVHKLLLGFKLDFVDEENAEEEGAAEAGAPAQDGAELARRAERIEKAVQVWKRTEQVATQQLRKLQQAILALNDEATKPVIRGLESILTRLDKVDDEALAAAEAAKQNDGHAFTKARADLLRKMNGILDYVEKDPLIRDADENPAVQTKIRETLSKSLNQLLKAI